MIGWIESTDMLPDDREMAIVAGGIAYMQDGVWKSATMHAAGREILWEVKCWMPMPKPPKELL